MKRERCTQRVFADRHLDQRDREWWLPRLKMRGRDERLSELLKSTIKGIGLEACLPSKPPRSIVSRQCEPKVLRIMPLVGSSVERKRALAAWEVSPLRSTGGTSPDSPSPVFLSPVLQTSAAPLISPGRESARRQFSLRCEQRSMSRNGAARPYVAQVRRVLLRRRDGPHESALTTHHRSRTPPRPQSSSRSSRSSSTHANEPL